MKILFIDDCNMFEGKDPYATLVELKFPVAKKYLEELENKQLGVHRSGGQYKPILIELQKEGNSNEVVSQGRLSDYKNHEYLEYKLISGNY